MPSTHFKIGPPYDPFNCGKRQIQPHLTLDLWGLHGYSKDKVCRQVFMQHYGVAVPHISCITGTPTNSTLPDASVLSLSVNNALPRLSRHLLDLQTRPRARPWPTGAEGQGPESFEGVQRAGRARQPLRPRSSGLDSSAMPMQPSSMRSCILKYHYQMERLKLG